MDYSLLLITEKNPDFVEKDELLTASTDFDKSVKSSNALLRPKTVEANRNLNRVSDSIQEVEVQLEDDEDTIDD